MLDDLDRTAIQLVNDDYGRLREQWWSPVHSSGSTPIVPANDMTPDAVAASVKRNTAGGAAPVVAHERADGTLRIIDGRLGGAASTGRRLGVTHQQRLLSPRGWCPVPGPGRMRPELGFVRLDSG